MGVFSIRYLAISKAPNYLAYAVFRDEVLEEYGVETFREFDEVLRLKEVFNLVTEIIGSTKTHVVVTHSLDVEKLLKKDLERLTEFKAMIKLSTIQTQRLYLEAKTTGWEKKILGRVTKARKLQLVHDGYDVQLDGVHAENIADAIILGEAVAHKRIHV